jgi:hypothetical protein
VEMALRILQDLVMLTLASIGIGSGVMTAFGDVRVLRQPLVRLVATVLLIGVGLWIFYVGIRHVVAD